MQVPLIIHLPKAAKRPGLTQALGGTKSLASETPTFHAANNRGTKMKHVLVVLLLGPGLTTCATAKNVDLSTIKSDSYESIVTTSDQTPRMSVPSGIGFLTSASVLGIVSGKVGMAKGDAVREAHAIDDPAGEIAKALGADLSTRLALSANHNDSGLPSGSWSSHSTLRSGKDLREAYGPARLVVNVGTYTWGVDSFSDDKFRFIYIANAELVDTNTSTVLGSAQCLINPKKSKQAPALSTMLENDAQVLKAEIQSAARSCLETLRQKLLGRTGQSSGSDAGAT